MVKKGSRSYCQSKRTVVGFGCWSRFTGWRVTQQVLTCSERCRGKAMRSLPKSCRALVSLGSCLAAVLREISFAADVLVLLVQKQLSFMMLCSSCVMGSNHSFIRSGRPSLRLCCNGIFQCLVHPPELCQKVVWALVHLCTEYFVLHLVGVRQTRPEVSGFCAAHVWPMWPMLVACSHGGGRVGVFPNILVFYE